MHLAVAACLLQACQPDERGTLSPEVRVEVERATRRLAADFIAADGAKDPDRVLALFADSASVAIVSSGQLRSSRSAFRDALEALYGSIRKLEIVEDEVRVAALGPDAAILTATYAYERIALDSTVTRGRAAITYGCRRRNGEWEIVHYHFSRAPGST